MVGGPFHGFLLRYDVVAVLPLHQQDYLTVTLDAFSPQPPPHPLFVACSLAPFRLSSGKLGRDEAALPPGLSKKHMAPMCFLRWRGRFKFPPPFSVHYSWCFVPYSHSLLTSGPPFSTFPLP